jgi:hypothetical protein
MSVTIPCGRGFPEGAVPPNHHALCSDGLLCPNCLALRDLRAACSTCADRVDLVLAVCCDDDAIDDLKPVSNRLRAALAASQPAGGTGEVPHE